MNQIAIIGHPASGYQEVESLLHQCGMQPPRPSRRDGLLPHDIAETLCKVHGVPALDQIASEDEVRQVHAGPVWHGMALDLMLGNLDQPVWGWSDPRMIFLLEFWAQLDPKLTFVLVYDTPHRVLIETARSGSQLAHDQHLERALDNWAAYNGALLRFFLRHPGRCLLVHSQQVRRAVDSYLQQLQLLVGTPLLQAPSTEGLEKPAHATEPLFQEGSTMLPVPAAITGELVQAIRAAGIDTERAAALLSAAPAEQYLVDEVLANHPAALELYAELESVANLPLGERPRRQGDALQAWLALARQRAFVSDLVLQLHAEFRRANDELARHQIELEQARADYARQLEATREQAEWAKAELSQREQKLKEYDEENHLMLTQLHLVQEELERLKAEQQAARDKLEQELKAARAKAEVDAKAATERAKQLKELGSENEMLLKQLHQVQEELERYYLENQRLKQKLNKPRPIGAAERVKQHLSYRLGKVMLEGSRSLKGWATMPVALLAEVRMYRKERADRMTKKLPPLHSYSDAHEAERVKRHLAYRLGKSLLECSTSPIGWLRLPFVLRRQVREFRLQQR